METELLNLEPALQSQVLVLVKDYIRVKIVRWKENQ